ncbi:MAG: SurA N-terminal domain-containing protein [Thermodesulfobacteriota bacterium]
MLQFMRKRASSIIIKGVLSLVILAFIFLGIGNFQDRQEVTAAKVNDDIVSAREFQFAYQRLLDSYRQQFGEAMNPDLLKMLNLKEQVMNQLVAEKIMLQEASKLGLHVSDTELAESISRIPAFQNNGRFDKTRYTRLLQSNRMTAAAFEQSQKQALLTEKLQKAITGNITVSENEARQWFEWENTQVGIKAAVFKGEKYADRMPTEEELTVYFDEHKDAYKTQEKRKLTYVQIQPARYLSTVKVSPEDIAAFYDENQDLYWNEKTVAARHILIPVKEDADEQAVEAARQKAVEIHAMVTGGKDFAETAKKYSQCPSAQNGGDLGTFAKDGMTAPFAEKAFSMSPGEISEPVRTQFGWHIIKVEKVNEPFVTPLETVRTNIEKRLVEEKAGEYAYDEALSLFDAALDAGSLEKAAAGKKLAAVTTDYLQPGDMIAGIENSQGMVRQAFDFNEGDISDVISVESTYYIFQVTRIEPAAVPELAAVKDAVTADLRVELQKEQAQSEARAVLERIKAGAALDEACAGTRAEVLTTGFFGRSGPIPVIGNEPALSRAAFELSAAAPVVPDVVEGENGYYVAVLDGKKPPEDQAFDEKKDAVLKRLAARKKSEAFMSWLTAMKAKSEIEIDEAFLK